LRDGAPSFPPYHHLEYPVTAGPSERIYLKSRVLLVRGYAGVSNDACRHGGMTELADSDLTEEQEMSLSGHSTPDAKRRYVKRTEASA